MTMPRLTESVSHPLTTFNRCQLCGFSDDDIVYFRMWYECDEHDHVEQPVRVLVACDPEKSKTKGHPCWKAIEDHPRLYWEVEWGLGEPGHFMLLCGDCQHRKGAACTHPDLKTNGGEGLMVQFHGPLALIGYHDESEPGDALRCRQWTGPAVACAGLPEEDSRHYREPETVEESSAPCDR